MSDVAITAAMVGALRQKTDAKMMQCKEALIATKGDFEAAVDWLRKNGLSAAEKKSDRIAAEGLTAVCVEDACSAIVEVNSETDFVAKNEKFQILVRDIAKLALKCSNIEELQACAMPSGMTVSDEIKEKIATIGEKLTLRRMDILKASQGVIGSYIHNGVASDLGQIAVLVALESQCQDKEQLELLAKNIAVHIAANDPKSIDADGVDPVIIEKERKIFFEQSKASGKPDNIITKMVEGRVQKFLSDIVLLKQSFLFDDKMTVEQVIGDYAKKLGTPIKITKFIRYKLGEGIEQQVTNFAAEVAGITNK